MILLMIARIAVEEHSPPSLVETWLEKKRDERGFQKIFSDLKQNHKEDFLIHDLKLEKDEKP